MVEPVKGKNPLVQSAQRIRLPLPGEIEDDEDEYEDTDEYEEEDEDGEEWPDVDSEPLREPQSEDEQFNGVNRRVHSGDQEGQPHKPARRKKKRKLVVPQPDEADVFVPPFEVLEDGTVVGPRVGEELDVMPEGFDPPKGSAEAAAQLIYGRAPQKSGGV